MALLLTNVMIHYWCTLACCKSSQKSDGCKDRHMDHMQLDDARRSEQTYPWSKAAVYNSVDPKNTLNTNKWAKVMDTMCISNYQFLLSFFQLLTPA